MIRKVLWGSAALALTVGGLAIGVGSASAGKAVHTGTITCNTVSTTNFKPSLVLTIPNKKEATETKPAKPGKDKKVKVSTTTAISGCTGTELSAGLTVPSGASETGKSSLASRLVTNAGSSGGGSSKITWSDGQKSKTAGTGSTTTFVDNQTPNDHSDDIPLPTSTDDVILLIQQGHGADGLYLIGSGDSITGKAYPNHASSSISHSPGILDKLTAATSPTGLLSITQTGTLTITAP